MLTVSNFGQLAPRETTSDKERIYYIYATVKKNDVYRNRSELNTAYKIGKYLLEDNKNK
jgi:hypothetical protein